MHYSKTDTIVTSHHSSDVKVHVRGRCEIGKQKRQRAICRPPAARSRIVGDVASLRRPQQRSGGHTRHLPIGAPLFEYIADHSTGLANAGLLSVFAEFERELLRERVKFGIAEARARDGKRGRPTTARLHAKEVRKLNDRGYRHE